MRVAASLFLLLLATSCVTVGDSQQVQTEINSLKHSSIKNRKELAALRKELKDFKAHTEAGGKLAKDDVIEALRTSQASLFTQVADMTAEVQSAAGGMDEIRYETRKTIEKIEAEMDVLKSSLTEDRGEAQDTGLDPNEISARLNAIEGALGILKTQVAALSASAVAASASSQSAPQSLYKKAYEQFEARSFTEARQLMRDFLAQYPRHELAGNALFWIGETHFNQKRYDSAILAYQDVIEKHPENRKVPAAHLKQAYSFAKLGEDVAARGILKTLLERHPDSDVAKFAEKKLKELE